MSEDRDSVPTPRSPTGTWAISVGRAGACVTRLRRAAETLRRNSEAFKSDAIGFRSANILRRRPEAAAVCDAQAESCATEAELCEARAEALELMIALFQSWPTMATCTCHPKSRAMVDEQRAPLKALLDRYQKETDDICRTLGPGY